MSFFRKQQQVIWLYRFFAIVFLVLLGGSIFLIIDWYTSRKVFDETAIMWSGSFMWWALCVVGFLMICASAFIACLTRFTNGHQKAYKTSIKILKISVIYFILAYISIYFIGLLSALKELFTE